ncbi:type II toxin-antitoxin system MqsA family antitoxin [Pseudomonas sp. 6D_7.1_Bac1]|uniref:type II toxin-antitoxin system MqsA family antitoxin n=1 Tax=Pseudomonas sp. 6D_7.1_Bac1 TaxID=2971615 RepID=UPI0021C98DD5|nr:type II toxin-antitoxin system MqsA family antitoxin [Pseudomonas sp. 6D_7.1_Bac1]MCU1749953.1 type II toxin-antitoxin system MqsA family antitoxin [Pseudomonas sp. 6D_7.1_Bac1]
MKTQQCFSCGTQDGMQHFDGRSFTIDFRQLTRQVHDISGWECQACSEIEFDDGSAVRYSEASDQLLEDSRQLMAAEMKRIRRKLHLTQKDAVKLLSGGGHNAFSRYERAEIAPPQPLFILMGLLDRHPDLLAELPDIANNVNIQRLLADNSVKTLPL